LSEPSSNIREICDECVGKAYPKKGKFTKSDIEKAKYVKKEFNREHMWVKIVEVTELGIRGIVNNDPEREGSPKNGTAVFVTFAEIEDTA